MKSGPTPEPRFKMLKLDIILAFGLLIIVIALASWYAASHRSTPTQNSSTANGWSEYTSSNYGFKFEYPTIWGKPEITSVKGKSGSHYQVKFIHKTKST